MKTGRKISGGKYKKPTKKKLTGRQKEARIVKLGEEKRTKTLVGRGSTSKIVALSDNTANVTHKGKSKVVSITNVIETPSNTFLARQNILVKGAIIDTELGNARITNRPSQEGFVQAVVISA
ncbi:MAG: small subunit ribosomal protein S8e [Patescibacteria group bacterium]|jgi:small subunit ribosomal protein S8e